MDLFENMLTDKEGISKLDEAHDLSLECQLEDLHAILNFRVLQKEGKVAQLSCKDVASIIYLQKTDDEIKQRIESVKAEQVARKRNVSLRGWEYVNKFRYLNEEQFGYFKDWVKSSSFENLDHDDFFDKINHLVYLDLEIKHLEKYHIHKRKGELENKRKNKLMDVLNILDAKNEAVVPLLAELIKIPGNYASEIIPYHTRIAYIKKKEDNAVARETNVLDVISKYKSTYKEEIKNLREYLKDFAKRGRIKDVRETANAYLYDCLNLTPLRNDKKSSSN